MIQIHLMFILNSTYPIVPFSHQCHNKISHTILLLKNSNSTSFPSPTWKTKPISIPIDISITDIFASSRFYLRHSGN